MLTTPALGWAIVDDITKKLVVVDGHMPIFWLRRVAVITANEHGFVTTGKDADVRICRVEIRRGRS